jgi:hypothetical protein
MTQAKPLFVFMLVAACAAPADASDLSYTFVDFQVLGHSVDARGTQSPTPQQVVEVDADGGDGIAVAGGIALPGRFYLGGQFASSVIDVDARVMSPLAIADVSGEFDLVTSSLAIGYQREVGETFDWIAELTHESAEYDFGSFAGENFDADDSGLGARVGFRWNPRPALELFASANYSPVGESVLDELGFDSDLLLNAGIRWYFFQDLGVGLDYQSGDMSRLALSMRFSFGNLPW